MHCKPSKHNTSHHSYSSGLYHCLLNSPLGFFPSLHFLFFLPLPLLLPIIGAPLAAASAAATVCVSLHLQQLLSVLFVLIWFFQYPGASFFWACKLVCSKLIWVEQQLLLVIMPLSWTIVSRTSNLSICITCNAIIMASSFLWILFLSSSNF